MPPTGQWIPATSVASFTVVVADMARSYRLCDRPGVEGTEAAAGPGSVPAADSQKLAKPLHVRRE